MARKGFSLSQCNFIDEFKILRVVLKPLRQEPLKTYNANAMQCIRSRMKNKKKRRKASIQSSRNEGSNKMRVKSSS